MTHEPLIRSGLTLKLAMDEWMRRLLRKFSPRNVWRQFAFRGVEFRDNYAAFRAAYLVADPYNLKSAQATYRFQATNRIIQENFGQVHRLLEIGCAEGYQSRHLRLLCDTLHGIDVSAKAIARAKARCPTGHFSAEDLFAIEGTFNLVVAAEVLYYMKDIPAVLNRMNRLGSNCLVTYFEPYADRLDHFFAHIPGVREEVFQFRDVRWKAVWWKTGGRPAFS